MQEFNYFPTTIYRDERPDFLSTVVPVCKKYIEEIREGGRTIPIIQTASLVHEPALREISDYLLLTAVNVLKNQGYLVEKYDFYISSMWAQEVSSGSGTNIHVHPNSQISGWFFIDAPEGGSYPMYLDTRMNKSMTELEYAPIEEVVSSTPAIAFNNITPGTVLFSNSWVQHQLVPNSGGQPTTCMHFVISHKERMTWNT